MSRKTTPLLVEDIWEAVEKIQRFVAGLAHDAFITDSETEGQVLFLALLQLGDELFVTSRQE